METIYNSLPWAVDAGLAHGIPRLIAPTGTCSLHLRQALCCKPFLQNHSDSIASVGICSCMQLLMEFNHSHLKDFSILQCLSLQDSLTMYWNIFFDPCTKWWTSQPNDKSQLTKSGSRSSHCKVKYDLPGQKG